METTQQQQRLAQIGRVRAAMRAGGDQPPAMPGQPLGERNWVWQSWQRCLGQGADPEHAAAFSPVTRSRMREAAAANRQLVHIAQPILHRLARAIAPLHYFVLLTDAHGTVLHAAGTRGRTDSATRAIARPGLDLSEQSAGTTAISGALAEQAPVWLHRGEHFYSNMAAYSCAGAPLRGPTGQCVGMIDLTGVQAVERPELMHLVAQHARQVEDALLLAQPHALAIHLEWPSLGGVAQPVAGGLLCVDADGRAVGSNQTAQQMLPQLQQAQPHLEDLFATPWTRLFDLARSGQPCRLPLWSGLHMQVRCQRHGNGKLAPTQARDQPPAAPPGVPRVRKLKTVEAELVLQAVREAGGRVDVAARALGISRATVYRRLRANGRHGAGD